MVVQRRDEKRKRFYFIATAEDVVGLSDSNLTDPSSR
jgi:hypothetical protein